VGDPVGPDDSKIDHVGGAFSVEELVVRLEKETV
jgi:hypothetical protein